MFADAKKMSFYVTDRWGGSDENPSIEQMKKILESLDINDDEHPDVSLEHDSGWCLSAFPSGLVIWEHLELRNPKHMRGVLRNKVLEMWIKLSHGEIESINSEPWQLGYK